MRRSRRVLSVLAGAAAALLATVATPAVAAAGTGSITIGLTGSPAGNRGLVSVAVQATTPITSLTLHLHPVSAHGQDVLDVSDLTLSGGSATDGTWTVQQPITAAQLPLGVYGVTVDATDSGGDSVSGGRAGGVVDFIVFPTITIQASPLTISYGNQNVTFSGQVTGEWPDGSIKPLAGQQVTVADDSLSQVLGQATAGPDGSYSLTATVPALPGFPNVYAAVVPTSTMAGTVRGVPISDAQDPVQVTAHFVSRRP